MKLIKTLLAVFAPALFAASAMAQDVPVEIPDGFTIAKVAGDELVPDASAMTVGPNGNPIVSGPGYVRQLLDKDNDGVFDSFETLAETKGIAQGIYFDGKQIWLTVDGALKRSVGKKPGEPFQFENVVPMSTDREHGSHAIRKGPDGWWYVIGGNATEIRKQYHSLDGSPVQEPRAGFVMRFPADTKTGEQFAGQVFCHGFRNAYDFDFDSDGNLFVYDSDGERDVSLPWYRPTRIFKMQAGDDAGWVSAAWKRPASFPDMPILVGEMGRGSPTGVAVCDGNTFGESYKGSVFVGDWTFGRIGVAIDGVGVEVFAKPRGNFGFAITDLEFAPGKGLYVTTGGRGTEGSLYLITAAENASDVLKAKKESGPADARQVLRMGPTSDENAFAERVAKVAQGESKTVPYDIRVLQLMLGGCNGDRMFAGHVANSPLEFSADNRAKIGDGLLALLNRKVSSFEVARLAGMVQPKHDQLANRLAELVVGEKDPVDRIHFLNCLALAGGKLDQQSVDQVADAFLRVRREIDEQELPVDRNWSPRMGQLANKLFRDMRIPDAIVKDPSFGIAADVWIFDSLPAIFYDVAVTKIAAKVEAAPDDASRQQIRCISVAPKYRDLIRSFAARPGFTDIAVKSIHASPKEEDWDLLIRGLDSIDLGVNKASLIGLRKLSAKPIVGSKNPIFEKLFRLESRLGWSNPEVSVRDQMVLLFQHWVTENQSYQMRQYDLSQPDQQTQKEAMQRWWKLFDDRYDAGTSELNQGSDIAQSLKRVAEVDFSIGDANRGKTAFKKFQCATCHNGGGKNSGPSLAGVASRFSRKDIFSAIVDPNANVPDRYRAILVATEDGQLFQGSVVYESKAGIMLATGTGEVARIDAADIEARRKTTKSLMPEGLLNEASEQEIADLWAYLKDL